MPRKICISIDVVALSASELEILRQAFLYKVQSDLFDVVISKSMPAVIAGNPDEIVIGFRFAGRSESSAAA
jgi:hypothetical protein